MSQLEAECHYEPKDVAQMTIDTEAIFLQNGEAEETIKFDPAAFQLPRHKPCSQSAA
jgi:hypothetical protein